MRGCEVFYPNTLSHHLHFVPHFELEVNPTGTLVRVVRVLEKFWRRLLQLSVLHTRMLQVVTHGSVDAVYAYRIGAAPYIVYPLCHRYSCC